MNCKSRLLYGSAIAILLAAMSGCGSQEYLVKDPTVLLTYQLAPNNENLENLAKAYNAQINKNRKAGIVEPGLCSDYAVVLAKLGRMDEANQYFNQEMSTFPSSATYVKTLQKQLSDAYEEAREVAQPRWQENDIVVDNPEDIEQMRPNKPRVAAELPNANQENVAANDDPDKDKATKGKKHHKKGKKHHKKH